MEELRSRPNADEDRRTTRDIPELDRWSRKVEESTRTDRSRNAIDSVRRYEHDHRKRSRRTKWAGAGLALLGVSTVAASCPFYAVALIGPETVLAGLGFLIGGGALLFRGARMKDTNRALLVAMKHGNRLTVTRLALEMDITFERSEKIINELVKRGIAEIDMERTLPDEPIVYKITGL